MSSRLRLVAVLLLVAGPALASPCTDRIDALEPRLDAAAEQTIAVSSGGQGVAAAREGQAIQAEEEGAPIAPATVPAFQDEAQETEATRDAADVGGGGDGIMQARVLLNEARMLDGEGNSAGCLEKVEQIEGTGAPVGRPAPLPRQSAPGRHARGRPLNRPPARPRSIAVPRAPAQSPFRGPPLNRRSAGAPAQSPFGVTSTASRVNVVHSASSAARFA